MKGAACLPYSIAGRFAGACGFLQTGRHNKTAGCGKGGIDRSRFVY